MYTMEDFKRDYIKKGFLKLTLEEQREVLHSMPPARREELRRCLDDVTPKRSTELHKQRRKK